MSKYVYVCLHLVGDDWDFEWEVERVFEYADEAYLWEEQEPSYRKVIMMEVE